MNHTYVLDQAGKLLTVPLVYTGDTSGTPRANVRESTQTNEVYTPVWICDKQINLADDKLTGSPLFSVASIDNKTRTVVEGGTSKLSGDEMVAYIDRKCLDMCCGEGAYLTQGVDATTGKQIPYEQRLGILDRKLKVAIALAQKENLTPVKLADLFYRATENIYGFDYNPRALIVARHAMLHSVKAHLKAYNEQTGLNVEIDEKRLGETVVRQLWQMDGATLCLPRSCSDTCRGCKRGGKQDHDGMDAVVFIDGTPIAFKALTGQSTMLF